MNTRVLESKHGLTILVRPLRNGDVVEGDKPLRPPLWDRPLE